MNQTNEDQPEQPDHDYFENIDIHQRTPDLRIPSPQQSWWTRCWQPIGTTVMNTEVLKEPRGFMRMLEWFFAILAFATCVNFTTHMDYAIKCREDSNTTVVTHIATYPFTLGKTQGQEVGCRQNGQLPSTSTMDPPGDFASDAQFFVFTGVLSFLSTMAILALYVFFSPIYDTPDKKAPMIDFCFTVVVAVFWLSASAAWANGLSSMKSIFEGDWIFMDHASLCKKTDAGTYSNVNVESCTMTFTGQWGGANVSAIFGFLNFFLWSANLWFLYKETAWFAARNPGPQPQSMEGQ